jgi:hypothetical protein
MKGKFNLVNDEIKEVEAISNHQRRECLKNIYQKCFPPSHSSSQKPLKRTKRKFIKQKPACIPYLAPYVACVLRKSKECEEDDCIIK